MHTVTVDISRPDKSSGKSLSKDLQYIISYADQPTVTIGIDCDQATFNEKRQLLRYYGVKEEDRLSAIDFFGKLVTGIFNRINPPISSEINKEPLNAFHLNLQVDAKELVQLPFELALNPNGVAGQPFVPFLLNQQRVITMTRSVRQTGVADYSWPKDSRILFVSASPNEGVPHAEHFTALRDIIKEIAFPDPTIAIPIPDIPKSITVQEKASLKSISEAIRKGIEDERPYTHVHILAHGSREKESINPDEFKISLHDDNDPSRPFYATGIELANAILAIEGNTAKPPALVSLMVCDSANTNVVLPAGSVANQLHEAGIPCVFASQFPLSVKGSVKLVETLYKRLLLKGDDPRRALYFMRRDLLERESHDWASLIVHVRFPKDINEQMKTYRLGVMLKGLETSSAWVEHLLGHITEIPSEKMIESLEKITDRLENSIKNLTEIIKEDNNTNGTENYAEQSGLIASAYKREAEHFFRLGNFKKDMKQELWQKSRETLKLAREWYLIGFKSVKQNHWTGIQYLSLKGVTKNSYDDRDRKFMTVVEVMATDASEETRGPEDRIWAWGTLMEFYLLQPLLAHQDEQVAEKVVALNAAKEYARKIGQAIVTFMNDNRITKEKIAFARKSTARQLNRYINWWPELLEDSYPKILKYMAIEILAELNRED